MAHMTSRDVRYVRVELTADYTRLSWCVAFIARSTLRKPIPVASGRPLLVGSCLQDAYEYFNVLTRSLPDSYVSFTSS